LRRREYRADEGGLLVDVYVALPTYGPGTTPGDILQSSVIAEELGFDGVAATDHFFVPYGNPDRFERVFEAITVLGAVAPLTSRVRLLLSVLILPMRNPFIAAKQLATLDQLSGGRLILGLGVGWNEEEYRNVGADFRTRGRRLDEGIRLLQHLFADRRSAFAGEYYPYDNGAFGPPPVQQADLKILIGGTSDAALRRAATFGHLWESNPVIGPERYAELLARLRAMAGPRPIQPGARINIPPGAEGQAEALAYAQAGAEHLLLEFAPFENFQQRMRRFAATVLPQLKGS
jgi:probable F420-dependent oxidoreductase